MIGETLSHYKIIEKLGEGGMGVVYKAQDTKLDRFVALKFLPPYLSSSDAEKQRFIHEAKAASTLEHNNICTVYEIDEIPTEGRVQIFIAMAYYEGETLKEKIDRGPLKLEEAIDIARQTAEGLAKAHEKEIVHRDLKPANIIITQDGIVKIVDFGLAKLGRLSKLPKAGTTLGTAAYMSPEQTQGIEVDHRTDIWALGVVLYEMITGQVPFKGDYEQAVTYAILNEEQEPITALRTGVPMELERLVNKCLQKEPSDRYQRIDELLVDLRLVKKEAQKPTFSTTKTRKKFTSSFTLPRVLILASLLAIAGYFYFRPEAEGNERIPIVVVDFFNETDEKELSSLSGMLITSLEQSRRLSVLSRARMFDVMKQLGKADVTFVDEATGREICKRANVQALAVATIRKFGQLYTVDFKIIQPETGEHLFTTREEGKGQESIPSMIDRLSEKTRIDLKEQENVVQLASRGIADITTTNLEAYHHYFLGEQHINKMEIERAKEEFRKAIAIDSTFGLAFYRLAYAINWQIESEPLAKVPMQKALELIQRIPEKEQYFVRALNAQLVEGYRSAAGIPFLQEREKIYPDDKEMLYNIGHWSFFADRYETAEKYFERVLEIDPTFERALLYLTGSYFQARQWGQMLEAGKRYVAASASADSYLFLGLAYAATDDIEMGFKTLQQARELYPGSELIAQLGLQLSISLRAKMTKPRWS